MQVRAHFRPEFVNRVDDFVVFDGLSKDQIKFIVKLQAKRVAERLAVKKMKLQLDETAEDYLVVSLKLHLTLDTSMRSIRAVYMDNQVLNCGAEARCPFAKLLCTILPVVPGSV